MSRENLEVVRSMLEPFAGVNVADVDWGAEAVRDAVRSVYAPDVELHTLPSGMGSGIAEHFEGLDGMVRYLQEWLEPFSDYRVDNLDYIEEGACVLVPSRQRGVGAASGVEVELELTTLYELRDGLITRIIQYDTLDEARRAATAVAGR
jgi:ketosteroid isomerase-like protein